MSEWVKVLFPTLAIVFAAGGLMFQVDNMNDQLVRLNESVAVNTSQLSRLTGQIEGLAQRVNIDIERRLTILEDRIHTHQSDKDLHGK